MRSSRVIAGLVLLALVLGGTSAYEKCPNCGLGEGEDVCNHAETVVKAAKLQKPGYLASPEAINYALKYQQAGLYGNYGPAIPGYGAPVLPYATPASVYGAPAYGAAYAAPASAYGGSNLHLTNVLDPESRYEVGDGGKTYEELQNLLYRKPGTPVAPLFKPVGDLCHSDGKGKHYGSSYGNAKGPHKIVGVTPAYPGKTPCKCPPPAEPKVYGPPRTYAPSSPYADLQYSRHYDNKWAHLLAAAAHPVSKPVYGPTPSAYPAPKPYGPPPPPASYLAPKPYGPPPPPASYLAPKPYGPPPPPASYLAPKPYGPPPPPASYLAPKPYGPPAAPAYPAHKPTLYGPHPTAYPAPAHPVPKPAYGPSLPAYPDPKPYGTHRSPYVTPKPYVPPVAYPTPKPYAPAHPAPSHYAPAKPAYSPASASYASVTKTAAYPPTVYSSTKTAYPSAAPAYAAAAPAYSAKPAYSKTAYSTASHYGHDDDDNEALSFAEQEQLYKAQPTIPADPVSISLAYKNFLQTPTAKKYVPEDRLAFGHRQLPADGTIHKEIANVPEEKLLTVDKPIVELKSPAKCSSSSYGGYTNRYADDDGYGDLEALERETEEASERARGAYVSYSDLGYGPVSPIRNQFVTKTSNVPSYPPPATYSAPSAAAAAYHPVPSAHLPCGPLGPTVPGYKPGAVLVEEKPTKAYAEDDRDGYGYKDDSEEYGSYSREDTGCSCKGGIIERLKPKCNKHKHERY